MDRLSFNRLLDRQFWLRLKRCNWIWMSRNIRNSQSTSNDTSELDGSILPAPGEAGLCDPLDIADFLNRAFQTSDLQIILQAFSSVVRAQNVLALAELTGLRREGLYRTFDGDNDPRFGRVFRLLAAMDIQLIVKALPPKPKPPRPKRGPPFQKKSGATVRKRAISSSSIFDQMKGRTPR
ncbi:probable addiction module antidote protein [Bradyrhizobium lablabi]|uniref:Probable addiction module antidote protein n=2 Tax=Nitrobacteraceae TaxID=41294 RepID=A0A1H4RDZ7_9BRAD|nr:probable addiction module antidote protein [Bradyrhizobium lablabi]